MAWCLFPKVPLPLFNYSKKGGNMALTVSWLLKKSTDTANYLCIAGEGGLKL